MLILRTDIDPDAPVVVCDWDCGWRKKIRVHEGGTWELTVAAVLEELDKHVAWTHTPLPPEPGWEVATSWAAQEDVPTAPEPERGPVWEPFASFPQSRGDVPGVTVMWRRLREPDREDTMIISAPAADDAEPLPPEVVSRPSR